MGIRFFGKLSLFLVFLSFPNFLPISSTSVLCPFLDWSAQAASDFGSDGRNGADGQAGRRGRDGQNQTIFADGSPVNLDLSGTDGENGENGRDGGNADCGRPQRETERDWHAASGGKGGNGGNGGDGGNGGSVTIYYTNLADLKKISVRSNAGRSGRNGRKGVGGDSCKCRVRNWERKTCTGTPGTPGYSCKTRRFSCTDGSDGADGSDGRDGKDGKLGNLTLINRKEALSPDQPNATVSMSELNNRVFALSKNKFQIRNGAVSLLASGSIIADQYREFVERLETSFQVVWNANRPITDFGGKPVTVSLEDNKQVKVNFPEDVWVDGTTSQQPGKTQFVATNVILKKEATQLARADFSGSGSDLNFVVVDNAGKSDLMTTQFKIKYSAARDGNTERNTNYMIKFEGNIPAELVSRSGNRFTLNIGKLPIEREFLKTGVPVEIELVTIRSFAGRSAEQKIEWRGEIKR